MIDESEKRRLAAVARHNAAQYIIKQEPCFTWYVNAVQNGGDVNYIDVDTGHIIASHNLMFAKYGLNRDHRLFANDGTYETELDKYYNPITKKKKRK